MPDAELLRSLAERHRYSRKRLCSPLAALNGSEPGALVSARKALRTVALAAIQAWTGLATLYEVPLLTVLRNLIALADREDLDVYRIFLEMPQVARLDPALRSALPAIREHIGGVGPDFQLVRTLLTTSRKPSSQEFWDFYGDPGQALTCSLAYARATGKSALGRELGRFARRADPIESLDVLVNLRRQGWITPLSRAELGRLPSPFRRAILGSPTTRRAILDPEFDAILRVNPRAHVDTPESLRHVALRPAREAARAIARWDFANPFVWGVVQSPDVLEVLPLLWSEIERIRPIPRGVPRPPAQFPDGNNGADQPFLAALQLLALPPARRIASLRDNAGIREAGARLPAREWVETLRATDDLELVRVALGSMGISQRADVLERVMRSAAPGTAWADHVVGAWLEFAPDYVFTALPRNPRWVARLWELEPSPALLIRFLPQLLALGETSRVLAVLTPEVLREEYGTTGSLGRRFHVAAMLRKALSQLAHSRRGRHVSTLVRSLVEADPGLRLLADVAHPTGDAAVDQLILDSIFRAVRPPAADSERNTHLISLIHRWMPVWRERLGMERTRARTPLASLTAGILATGGSAFDAAARAYPEVFIRIALRQHPLEDTLSKVFTDPFLAAWVERLAGRRRLLGMIPWVKAKWEDAPGVAIALELALACSLPDARYLIELAKLAAEREEDGAGSVFDDLYRTYALPKRSGGNRTITVPDARLKRLQRRILDNAISPIPLHAAANGFRPGSSVLTNALPHVGKPMVVNLDIESFFPSTRHELIVRACRKVAGGKLSPGAVMLLADICSYQGALPTGAPTSPAIGNLVLTPVDKALSRAAARFSIAYTRYADDLTFSGGGDTHRIVPFVRKVLTSLGFAVEEKKVNMFRRGRRQIVTGLVVNEKPNLPRRLRRRLRAAVHHRATGREPHWRGRPMRDAELIGHLAVLNLVQPEESRRYRKVVKAAAQAERANG